MGSRLMPPEWLRKALHIFRHDAPSVETTIGHPAVGNSLGFALHNYARLNYARIMILIRLNTYDSFNLIMHLINNHSIKYIQNCGSQ